MKNFVKRAIAGTPLEPVAHSVYRAVTGKSPLGQPAALPKNELYDLQTTQVMERVLAPDSNCIDVGCHAGAVLDEMLRLAPRGHHLAFEPLPDLFAKLQAKYAGRTGVTLHEAALSDSAGTSTFQHVVTNPAYSGILQRHFDRPHEDVVPITVRLERLDDVVPAGTPVRFVKIDVEGAELQVLRGAQRVLRENRPWVVFEHGLGASDVYGTRPEMVLDLFAACGLRISLLGDWLHTPGRKVLSKAAFVRQFETCTNHYFLAHR
jgi:FkbM family methyltransferase